MEGVIIENYVLNGFIDPIRYSDIRWCNFYTKRFAISIWKEAVIIGD